MKLQLPPTPIKFNPLQGNQKTTKIGRPWPLILSYLYVNELMKIEIPKPAKKKRPIGNKKIKCSVARQRISVKYLSSVELREERAQHMFWLIQRIYTTIYYTYLHWNDSSSLALWASTRESAGLLAKENMRKIRGYWWYCFVYMSFVLWCCLLLPFAAAAATAGV